MSQMRKDIFTSSWVIVAETNTVRPSDFYFKRFVRENNGGLRVHSSLLLSIALHE